MKKQLFLILACLVGTVRAFASGCDTDYCCGNECLDFDSKFTVDIGGGLRWDNLSLSTHRRCFHTKERLKDIKIGLIEADVQFLACEHFLLKGYFNYGWVYGKTRSSIREGERFSFSSSDSSGGFSAHSRKGHAYDLYGAVGYQFNWDCYQAAFAPLVGYSYNFLKLDRGHFDRGEYSGYSRASCSDDNGKGTKFSFSGPWVGFASTYQATCALLFYLDYAFHWANFRATTTDGFLSGNVWNHHKSKAAHGNEVVVGGTYSLCEWTLGLKFDYRNWYTSKGHHGSSHHHSGSVYGSGSGGSGGSDGSESSNSSSVRKLNWNTYIVTLDIGYSF